jgi:NDP-sugar pyrophosphorylase family protein
MKIIVPMAGSGARFVAQGYADPKPLIRMTCDSRRIIEHVLDMFTDPSDEFIFICNEAHLKNTDMGKILYDLKPGCIVCAIEPHKLGPVYTLLPALDLLDGDEEVIVSYCDGTIHWDREDFTLKTAWMDACIFTHTGFHPHTLSSTKMAFVKPNEFGKVLEVKEKASYTDNPQSEHASSGVYYFRRAHYLKKYAREQLAEKITHNGEYYVTLLYNLLIRDGLDVGYFDTEFFACLGTPEEVRNFEAWATITRNPHLRTTDDILNCYEYWKKYWHGNPSNLPQGTG